MKRVILFLFSLFLILHSFALAKDMHIDKRFCLSASFLHTGPTSSNLSSVTGGGEIGFQVKIEYSLKPGSYFVPYIGFGLEKLPLQGKKLLYAVDPGGLKEESYTSDWSIWATGINFGIAIDEDILTPFVEAGVRLYQIGFDFPVPREDNGFSGNYLGYCASFGLKVSSNRLPISLFGELGYHNIPSIEPPINLEPELRSAGIVSYGGGIEFRFGL